jgi:hypothetical protein
VLAFEVDQGLSESDEVLVLVLRSGAEQLSATRTPHARYGASAASLRVDTSPCAIANQACAGPSCLDSQPRESSLSAGPRLRQNFVCRRRAGRSLWIATALT